MLILCATDIRIRIRKHRLDINRPYICWMFLILSYLSYKMFRLHAHLVSFNIRRCPMSPLSIQITAASLWISTVLLRVLNAYSELHLSCFLLRFTFFIKYNLFNKNMFVIVCMCGYFPSIIGYLFPWPYDRLLCMFSETRAVLFFSGCTCVVSVYCLLLFVKFCDMCHCTRWCIWYLSWSKSRLISRSLEIYMWYDNGRENNWAKSMWFKRVFG